MPKNNKILNDLSKMASSTVATMVNIKNDLSTYVHNQVKASLKGMDFATRSEINALKKTIVELQSELKSLKGSSHTHAKGGAPVAKKVQAVKKVAKPAAKKKVAPKVAKKSTKPIAKK